MAPKVSVLLPARNAAATLTRAVRSVLAQSFSDFELVAVDDGSSDETGALLSGFAREDRRVRVLRGEGRGLVRALERGLAECRGELVARMDADDESHPERLAAQVAALDAEPGLAGIGSQVEIFRDDQPVSPGLQRYGAWLNTLTTVEALERNRFIESPLCHPSVTLRTRVLREVGGFYDGPFPEDYELWLRLITRGHRLRCLERVLHRWRDHDQRLTRTDARYERRRFLPLKAEHLVPYLAGRRAIVWGTGPTGLRLTRELRARGVHVSHFVEVNQKKIGGTIHDTPVLSEFTLEPPGAAHVLGAVGAHGARDEIREILTGRGWTEADYTFVA